MTVHLYPPEAGSTSLGILIAEIEKGIVKIPQFQRDFVWKRDASAKLLDSILKGYPIGTFIFWKTKEELRSIRNIGGLELPKTPKGDFILYVLDGQQRLTSLFAAVKGLKIKRVDEPEEDFGRFYVDLGAKADEPIVVVEPAPDAEEYRYILLHDLMFGKIKTYSSYPEDAQEKIQFYKERLNSYQFALVTMKEAPIDVATEVFERLNTGGTKLSVFEIMVAKTFDIDRDFDLALKFDALIAEFSTVDYGTLPDSTVLQLIAFCVGPDAKKKAILSIPKNQFIDAWEPATTGLKRAVEYLRNKIRVPVSELLPYPALIVPIAYYFIKTGKAPDAIRSEMLQDFFWRVGLGERYSRSLETNLAQDIKRIEQIVQGVQPKYEWDVDTSADYILNNGGFSTSRSYVKTLLCLMASKQPLSLRDNSIVNISNRWLSRADSMNYHHFFPKAFLEKQSCDSWWINHVVNITLVDDQLNKREIRAKAPSKYVAGFAKDNPELKKALASHFIGESGFGVEEDDYDTFLKKRAERLSKALEAKLIKAVDAGRKLK
jgi:hypothetical protein